MRKQSVGKADGLEYTQGLVVQTDGARVIDELIQLFQDRDAHALQAENIRDHQPNRAGSDDGHVRRDVGTGVSHGTGGFVECTHVSRSFFERERAPHAGLARSNGVLRSLIPSRLVSSANRWAGVGRRARRLRRHSLTPKRRCLR